MSENRAPAAVTGSPAGAPVLVRPRERLLTGVCAALARKWDIDPLLVRVGVGLLALSSGIGLTLYAVAWLWIPSEGEAEAIIHHQVPSSRHWPWFWVVLGITATCIATMILLAPVSAFGIWPAMVVGFLGGWNWHRRRRAAHSPEEFTHRDETATSLSPRFDAASQAWNRRLDEVYSGQGPVSPAPDRPHVDPYRKPPPRLTVATRPGRAALVPRRRSWWMTLAMVGSAGIAVLVSMPFTSGMTQAWPLRAAIALAVVALFLLIGAVSVRPRLGVLTGVVVTLAMVQAFLGPALQPTGPQGTVSYTTTSSVPHTLDLRLRSTTLDFSSLRLDQPTTMTLNVTMSEVEIIGPPGPCVIIYDLRAASLIDGDQRHDDSSQSGTITRAGEGAALTIRLQVTAGEVQLT